MAQGLNTAGDDALDFSFLQQSPPVPTPDGPALVAQSPLAAQGMAEPTGPTGSTALIARAGTPQALAPATSVAPALSPDALDFSFLQEVSAKLTDTEVTVDDAEIAAQSLNAASRYSRQQVLDARRNAQTLGITFDEALTHGAAASQIARQASVEDLRKFSPRLVQALQGKAAYADRGDVPHLDGVATAFDGLSLSDDDIDAALTAPRSSGRISQRMQEGAQQMGDALRGSMLGVLEGYLADTRREVENNAKFYGYDLENDPYYSGIKGLVDRWKAGVRENAPQRVPTLPPAETALGRYGEAVAQMAPQVLGQLASFAMGGGLLSAGFMASQIAGGTYNELTDKGVDADRALYAALGSTLGQVPLEQLSLNKALAVFKTSGAWNTVKALLGSATTEATTEFLQAYPQAIAEIWATTSQADGNFEQGLKEFADTFGDITLQGLYEGAVAAPYGALFGGVGMLRNGRAAAEGGIPGFGDGGVDSVLGNMGTISPELVDALRAETRQLEIMRQRESFGAALTTAAAHIDASATTAQDPEAMAEIVEELLPQNFREAWLGADEAHALYQSAVQRDSASPLPGTEAQAVLAALGTDADALQAAVAQGAPLPLPTAKALTLFQGDARTALLDNLRATPDGVSGVEARDFDPKARMDAALESVRSSQKIRSEVNKEITRITQEIHDIKSADGKRLYPEHVAKAYAALHAQQALAFSAAYGVDPVVDLLARRNFARAEDVGSGAAEGMVADAQALAQAAMYRNKASNVREFVDVLENNYKENERSYYNLGRVERENIQGELQLSAVHGKHIRNKHPDFDDYESIYDVVQHGEHFDAGLYKNMNAQAHVFVRNEGKNSMVVVAAQVDGKEHGKRVYVITAYKDSSKRVENDIKKGAATLYQGAGHPGVFQASERGELEQSASQDAGVVNTRTGDNNAALYQSAGGSPAYPSPASGDAISELKSGVSGKSVAQTEGSVNIENAQNQKDNAAQSTPRGYTTLTPQSAAVRIFDGADLSTIPHESMHIFLDDLMTVAADDGSIALAEMQRRVEATLHSRGTAVQSVNAVRELMQEVATAAPAQRLTALHAARESLKRMVKDARDTAVNAEAAATAMRQQQEESGQPLDPTRLPPWSELNITAFNAREDASAATTAVNAVSRAMHHLHGLEKARADVAVLCRYAGVFDGQHMYSVKFKLDVPKEQGEQSYKDHRLAEIEIAPSLYAGQTAADAAMATYQTEGAISEINLDVLRGNVKPAGIVGGVLFQDQANYKETSDWRTLHEATAQAFEVYLSEGNAPSAELKHVFSRMREWLLKLWQDFKEKRPAQEINADVRRVFDRMLATDKQLSQSRELRSVLRAEDEFLESGQLTHDEWRELTDLRNQAEVEVTAAMDRSTLRDRKQRRAAHVKVALESLADDPFWLAVDNLSARVKDVRRAAPDHGLGGSAGGAPPPYVKNAADPAAPSRGGLNKASVARLIGAQQTAELSKRRPGLINGQGAGMPIDLAAMEYGVDLGLAEDDDAFANLLYDRIVVQGESRRVLAERMADQAMEQEDSHAAEMGMHAGTEAYAAYLDKVDAVILRLMAQKKYRSEREQARFVSNSIVPRVRIQQMASDEIMHTPLKLISPARYQAMLDKALKDRAKAVLAGDVVKALDAVERARLANELRGRAAEMLSRRDATLALAARLASAKPGTLPTVQREALRKVLSLYNLGRVGGVADGALSGSSLGELIRQTLGDTADGVLPSFPSWVLNGTHPDTGESISGMMDYRNLTPLQLQSVHDMLKFLQKSAFDQRTDNAKAEAARVNAVVTQTTNAMAGLQDVQLAEADTVRRRVQDTLRGIYGAVDALRWQCRKADGLTNIMGQGNAGAAERALLDPVLQGEQRARVRLEEISTMMAPHLVHLADSVKAWEQQYGKNLTLKDKHGKPVVVPQAVQAAYRRKSWTADMVIALALNVGNDSNLRRITSFYSDLDHDTVAALLGDAVADRIFGTRTVVDAHAPQGLLSLQDWQAIQGIWDALASQWADTQAVHERMYGFKPQGVEPKPMIVVDNRTGQHVALSGGYYPVHYDPKLSDRVAKWNENDNILARNDSLFAVPSAKRGHTKAREGNAPELPIRLDTGIIMEHVNDAVRLIELGEITRFADKVTQHAAFRSEYTRVYGKADYHAIRPNLRGLVLTEPPPKNEIVKIANGVRKYLVPWGLAWNFKVAALQLTAIFPAMGDMGTMPVMRGMAWLAAHRMEGMRAIWQASPYMQSRINNIDQDLQRNMANFNPAKRPASVTVAGREFTWEDIVDAGMLPIVTMDAVATGSVWMGAYSQKLAQLEGANPTATIQAESVHHQAAVDHADSMVKQGNPDFDASSRGAFLRANDTYRLFNNFASAVTLFAQRHHIMYTARSKGKVSLKELARFEMFETAIPATAVFVLLALARGYFGDDDDDKETLKFFMSTSFDFVSMRLPIFGGLLGSAALSMLGMSEGGVAGRGGIRTALDAPVDFVASLSGRSGKALWQEGDISDDQAKRLVYGAADIVSFILRVPISKKIRDGERGYDQWQRGEGTPLSVIVPRPGK